MLKNFLLNITLLISIFTILGQVIQKFPRFLVSSLRLKLGIGFGLGLIGIMLMKFTIYVTPTMIADLRHLPIIVAALYGGLPASILAAGVIAIGRFSFFTWDHSFIVSFAMLTIGILCGGLSRIPINQYMKALLMNVISLVIITIYYFEFTKDHTIVLQFLPYYYTFCLIGGVFVYYLVEYTIQSNDTAQKLKESEERYRQLVVQSPDPIVIHDGNYILFANKKATKLSGATSYNHLVQRSIFDLVHPDYHHVMMARIRNMRKNKKDFGTIELKINTINGRLLDIEISATPIIYKGKSAFQVVLRDITARKRMENDLRESEERYRFIADNSTDLISILSVEGNYVYNSPACKDLTGYTPNELLGKSCFDYIYHEDLPKVKKLHHQALNGVVDTMIIQYRYRQKDQSYRWHETTARTIRKEKGDIHQILAIARDITERKKLEDELLQSNKELQKLSTLDGLTGIPNRRYFEERLNRDWLLSIQGYDRLFIMLIDIDYFKNYNDTYGHQAGDDCLIMVAHCLQSTLKRSEDFIARFGGEEFVVILRNTDDKGAIHVAEELRRNIEKLQIPHLASQGSDRVTISLGIASTIPRIDSDPQDLIRKADQALYLAKQKGRNQYKLFAD